MDIVRILLLTAHLLLVNVAAGAPLVCLGLEWRPGRLSSDAIRYLAAAALLGLIGGGLLGVVIGLLEWEGAYARLWSVQLSRKVYWAAWELLFSTVLLGVYWLWPRRDDAPRGRAAIRSLLVVVASLNLLYHFPPLFFVAQKLDTVEASEPLTAAQFRGLMYSGETPALTLHFAVASVAVAGMLLLGMALRRLRQGAADDAKQLAVWGGRWALVPTLVQLPLGLWTLTTLPRTMQNQLIGSNLLGMAVFALAIGAALWLTRELVTLAMGETDRGSMHRAMLAMCFTVLLMTASHEIARSGDRPRVWQPSVQQNDSPVTFSQSRNGAQR